MHTHKGHCQICGLVHAVNPRRTTLAKHGYKVAGLGYFFGTCAGSNHQPLQISQALTKDMLVELTGWAELQDIAIAEYQHGTRVPGLCDTGKHKYHNGKWVDVMIPWAEANEYQRQRAVESIVGKLRNEAFAARTHIKLMTALAVRIHGTALLPRTEPAV